MVIESRLTRCAMLSAAMRAIESQSGSRLPDRSIVLAIGTNSVLPVGTTQVRSTGCVPSDIARNQTSPSCFAAHCAPVVSAIGLLSRENVAIHCR